VRQVVAVVQPPTVTATDLDLGTVMPGVPGDEWSLNVVNRGPSTFLPATVKSSNPDFAVTGGTCSLGLPVPRGAWCTVLVVLTPSKPGRVTGTVTVTEAGIDPVTVSAAVAGAAGEPALAPTSDGGVVLEGTVVGSRSQPVEFSITNVGLLPARIGSAAVTGVDRADFTVDDSGCTQTVLAAGAACPLTVTFTPTGAGHRTAVVTVATATGQYTSVLVTGEGRYQPTLTVDQSLVLAGRGIEVTGTGFPAGSKVALSWSDDPAHAVTALADGAGRFVTTFVVSAAERAGDHQLVAQVPDAVATAQVTVARSSAGVAGQPRWPAR
jgi:hypothetical protein